MTSDMDQPMSSTGVKTLDKLLGGGLFMGENVVLEVESGTFAREFLYSFMKQGVEDKKQIIYLDFMYPPQALMLQLTSLIKKFPAGWEEKFLVLDCFSESSGQGELIFNDFYDTAPTWMRKVPTSKDPQQFHNFFGRIEREFVTLGTRLVFNSLSLMQHVWGQDAVKSFFGHICPALYAYKTLAYWTIVRDAHPREFCAMIEHITQVVIDLSREGGQRFLEVKKAGGRYDPQTYQCNEYTVQGLDIEILPKHSPTKRDTMDRTRGKNAR
jgi:KaiC/GvpD/RAD55 family RecA-like ATPase